jgi:hypothetical protein
MKCWLLVNPKASFVPLFITWGIYLYMNSILFEWHRKLLEITGKKVLKAIEEYVIDPWEVKINSLINPVFFGNSHVGFVDGAATEEQSGIGLVVKVSPSHCFKAHMTVRTSTNIREELLAL